MSMRKESREITSDRREILRRCTDIYKSFYIQTVPIPEGTIKSSPDTKEIHKFTEEVKKAIQRLKRHIAYGMDGITSGIIKLGRWRGEGECPHLPNKHLQ